MIIGSCVLHLSAGWVNSLKEKRSVVKSIIEKVKHRYNVSIAEISDQDAHKAIVLGFCCASNERRHAESTMTNVLNFIENNTEAVVTGVEMEIL
ncbi:MAG: DUF503 domain-containing protein [Defluviitaleaceae bacterium]|nr:DUF503 domain-containing protein [Defluviitaleaceae bacterium]